MHDVSRFAKPATVLALLTALGVAGYSAGRAGATCYTGCQSNRTFVHDDDYNITVKIDQIPVLLDFTGSGNPTPLCSGAQSPPSKPYISGGTDPFCSMGPSRYSDTTTSFDEDDKDGDISVTTCQGCS